VRFDKVQNVAEGFVYLGAAGATETKMGRTTADLSKALKTTLRYSNYISDSFVSWLTLYAFKWRFWSGPSSMK